MASAPQSRGVVPAAGCQKRRRRVKRYRVNMAYVPLQSRHTSRRRVVAGQQPQSRVLVPAAGCQKRRRRVKRHRVNIVIMPLQSRHTSRRLSQDELSQDSSHNLAVLSPLPVARSGAVG